MKKKLVAILMGTVLTFAMGASAFAASESFSVGGVDGTVSLTRSTSGATGKTVFGVGRDVTATRTVKVTLTYTKDGKTYTNTESSTAVTNSANYKSTTASISVYRPSSKYTVTKANSTHTVKMSSASYSRNLSQ